MMHVVEQTRDEKIAMYMKLTKREITEMLVNCNDALALLKPTHQWVDIPPLPNPAAGTVTIVRAPTIWSN